MDINKKINRVIASCKTQVQMEGAIKYLLLAEKTEVISGVRVIYWAGVINGIAYAKGWE